jgi:hypothetical protein
MDTPATPLEVYKAIIDKLVKETPLYGSGPRVAQRGIFSNAPAHKEYNDFICTLTPEHRALLARMLNEERQSGVFAVLADLTWWITTRDVGLTFRGEPMPIELSGEGLHGDYVARSDGWEWPSDDA